MRIAMIGARGIAGKYSGIETHLEELCPRLVERGHEVIVYARSYFTVQREYRGVRIVRLPTIRTKHLETLVHSFLATVHSLRSSLDIVHFHAQGPAIFAFLPRLVGARVVVTVHGLDWQRDKWGPVAKWCLKRAEKSSATFPHAVITVSRYLRSYYTAQYGSEKVYYIPNGVTVPTIKKPDSISRMGLAPRRYVLFVGRLTPEKGCHHLVEAFQKMDVDFRLAIAGAPTYTDSYLRKLQERANGKVVFLGAVYGDVLGELYSNAYVFVLPSLLEGLPMSLLEAMSYGCCVVASDIPPNVEVVGDAGLLFRAGSVESLCQMLHRAFEAPQIVRELGDLARRRVSSNYNWEAIASQTEALYAYLLSDRLVSVGNT